MKPELQILGWALTAAVTLLGVILTRRSAQDSTGASLAIDLLKEQRTELTAVRNELTTVKTQVRQHRTWDIQVYDAMRDAGMPVDPPPPLE